MARPDISAEKTAELREKARNEVKRQILEWYAENSGGKMPTNICEDRKAYAGTVLWYLEPPVPMMDNPILIEAFHGDHWTLAIEFGKLP